MVKLFQKKNLKIKIVTVRKNVNVLERINEAESKIIFQQLWNMSDIDKQNLFLCESVHSYPVKRRRPINYAGTLRTNVYKFHLSTPRENILVCKKFFINTFNISMGRIDRILKVKDIPKDMRGRMDGSCRRTSELAKKFVRERIKSFPAFKSHYTRSQNSEQKYLNPELNINKMFNLYLEKCAEINEIAVNE